MDVKYNIAEHRGIYSCLRYRRLRRDTLCVRYDETAKQCFANRNTQLSTWQVNKTACKFSTAARIELQGRNDDRFRSYTSKPVHKLTGKGWWLKLAEGGWLAWS